MSIPAHLYLNNNALLDFGCLQPACFPQLIDSGKHLSSNLVSYIKTQTMPEIFSNTLETISIIYGFPTAIKTAEMTAAITVTIAYSRVDCPFWHNSSFLFK
jgi:hypothetical protein